jgi:hypothetical protein
METPIGNTVFLLNYDCSKFFQIIDSPVLDRENAFLGPIQSMNIGELRANAGKWSALLNLPIEFDNMSIKECAKLESVLQVQNRLVTILNDMSFDDLLQFAHNIDHIIPLGVKVCHVTWCWEAIPPEIRMQYGERFFKRNPNMKRSVVGFNNWRIDLVRSSSYNISQQIIFARLCGLEKVDWLTGSINATVRNQLTSAGYTVEDDSTVHIISWANAE